MLIYVLISINWRQGNVLEANRTKVVIRTVINERHILIFEPFFEPSESLFGRESNGSTSTVRLVEIESFSVTPKRLVQLLKPPEKQVKLKTFLRGRETLNLMSVTFPVKGPKRMASNGGSNPSTVNASS